MKRFPFALVALMLAGCPAKTQQDAGTNDDVPYTGETSGGAVPIIPDEPDPEDTDDAGEVVVDARCCEMAFAISDLEAADVTGRLRATHGPAAADGGVELTRDGGWFAASCMPVKSSIRYWFEFSTPPAEDGGDPSIEVRADPSAPTQLGFSGDLVNSFGPVNDCSEVDAGTGTWSP